jgi:GT2 family glycosyltransferase
MPVHNGEPYLREAIESILRQSYREFEFIIGDDGSTDRSAETVRSYDDSRITIFSNERQSGITTTLNKAIVRAKGSFICRMDSDDVALPQRIERQVEELGRHRELAAIGSNTTLIDERGGVIGEEDFPQSPADVRKLIFHHNPFAHGSMMIRRSTLERIGVYDNRFKHNEDYDLWLRICAQYPMTNLAERLLLRRIHGASVTASKQVELAAFRVRTLSHAIMHYYKNPFAMVYLGRSVASLAYHSVRSVTSAITGR